MLQHNLLDISRLRHDVCVLHTGLRLLQELLLLMLKLNLRNLVLELLLLLLDCVLLHVRHRLKIRKLLETVEKATLEIYLLENDLLLLLLTLQLVTGEKLLRVLLEHRRELTVDVAHHNHPEKKV